MALCLLAFACVVSAVPNAAAQEGAFGGAYRGLFPPPSIAASALQPSRANTSDLSIQAFWLGEVTRSGTSGANRAAQPASRNTYAGIQAEAARTHVGERVSYEVRGSSQFRHQSAAGGLSIDAQWAALSIRALADARTALSIVQRVSYAPTFTPGVASVSGSLTGDTPSVAPVPGVEALKNVSIGSAVSVTRQLSHLASAGFTYSFDRVGFSSTGAAVATHRVLLTLNKSIRRDLSYQLTYASLWSITTGTSALSATRSDDVGLALSYAPPRSSRTTLVFGVTPTFARRGEPAGSATATSAADRRQMLTLGGWARMAYRLTSTWRAEAGYQRLVYYLPGNSQAIQAHAVNGGISGGLRSWMTASLTAAYSRGTPDLQQSQGRVTNLSAAARVDMRLGQSASIYAESRFDAYAVAGNIPTLPGLSKNSTRWSLRVGLTVTPESARLLGKRKPARS
jgi:hypothetical protein